MIYAPARAGQSVLRARFPGLWNGAKLTAELPLLPYPGRVLSISVPLTQALKAPQQTETKDSY